MLELSVGVLEAMILLLVFAEGVLVAPEALDEDILLVGFDSVGRSDPLVAGDLAVFLSSIVLHLN